MEGKKKGKKAKEIDDRESIKIFVHVKGADNIKKEEERKRKEAKKKEKEQESRR